MIARSLNFQKYLHYAIGLVIVMGLLFLNGCSTTSHRDGPPPFSVDETKIPNAVPKKEALSKYGNYPSYRVFGKRYYTLTSSKHYEAQGVASWYGTKFHKMRTSSGERYNMLGMTAAHKTLPLPTYVEVTNLKNGNKIIVKVNDRGPFESNRLIDLSYVAAKKLGMLGHGTAYVNVKAIDLEEFNQPRRMYAYANPPTTKIRSHNLTSHRYTSTHLAQSGYYLQVGIFKNRHYAVRLQQRLTKVLSSPVQIAHTKSKKLYRVQIGPIKDTATANNISRQLRSIGLTQTSRIKGTMEA